MIEDGHFKEMRFILDYIYRRRVETKKLKILRQKSQSDNQNNEEYMKKENVIQFIKGQDK